MAEYRLPPRQKMINLVYIILIAMLAINISADTLDTYSLLNKGLDRRIDNLCTLSDRLSEEIISGHSSMEANILMIDSMTYSLLTHIDGIKEEIARAADKKKYTSAAGLKAQEELNAVPDVMLSAVNPRASRLKAAVERYKDTLLARTSDPDVQSLIESCLGMDRERVMTSWEKATFTSMPAIGGMVYMNTLKENILLSGIEARRDMAASIARGKLAATDSINARSRYVLINNDQKIVDKNGTIEVPVVNVSPYIESVIYAGFDNPISILAIGITPDDIKYTVKGGRGYLRDGRYYIAPDAESTEVILQMSCMRKGRLQDLGSQTFKVKPLPVPSPYIRFSDGTLYTGNVPIRKDRLASVASVGAGISDPVRINYSVTRFETVLIKGNSQEVMSAISEGPNLTTQQKRILSSAENGDKIYFTGIQVKNPRGTDTYELPPISAPVYE